MTCRSALQCKIKTNRTEFLLIPHPNSKYFHSPACCKNAGCHLQWSDNVLPNDTLIGHCTLLFSSCNFAPVLNVILCLMDSTSIIVIIRCSTNFTLLTNVPVRNFRIREVELYTVDTWILWRHIKISSSYITCTPTSHLCASACSTPLLRFWCSSCRSSQILHLF